MGLYKGCIEESYDWWSEQVQEGSDKNRAWIIRNKIVALLVVSFESNNTFSGYLTADVMLMQHAVLFVYMSAWEGLLFAKHSTLTLKFIFVSPNMSRKSNSCHFW